MPKFFKDWLKQLSDKDAERLWNYFDGSFTVTEEVVDVIADSHKQLAVKLCADPNAHTKGYLKKEKK